MTAVQQFAELEPLAAAIRDDKLGDFRAASPFAACLMPLLTALKWRGSPRDIAEALPHVADTLDLVDLRNVLAYEEERVIRFEMFGDEIEAILEVDPLRGEILADKKKATIYPSSGE